ncbi:unnamed protein product [Amoebophrya sp. A120]|nr:unnamed protein product [Amoebophrya sp. A120]|eukprot:GSA120T00006902001.1
MPWLSNQYEGQGWRKWKSNSPASGPGHGQGAWYAHKWACTQDAMSKVRQGSVLCDVAQIRDDDFTSWERPLFRDFMALFLQHWNETNIRRLLAQLQPLERHCLLCYEDKDGLHHVMDQIPTPKTCTHVEYCRCHHNCCVHSLCLGARNWAPGQFYDPGTLRDKTGTYEGDIFCQSSTTELPQEAKALHGASGAKGQLPPDFQTAFLQAIRAIKSTIGVPFDRHQPGGRRQPVGLVHMLNDPETERSHIPLNKYRQFGPNQPCHDSIFAVSRGCLKQVPYANIFVSERSFTTHVNGTGAPNQVRSPDLDFQELRSHLPHLITTSYSHTNPPDWFNGGLGPSCLNWTGHHGAVHKFHSCGHRDAIRELGLIERRERVDGDGTPTLSLFVDWRKLDVDDVVRGKHGPCLHDLALLVERSLKDFLKFEDFTSPLADAIMEYAQAQHALVGSEESWELRSPDSPSAPAKGRKFEPKARLGSSNRKRPPPFSPSRGGDEIRSPEPDSDDSRQFYRRASPPGSSAGVDTRRPAPDPSMSKTPLATRPQSAPSSSSSPQRRQSRSRSRRSGSRRSGSRRSGFRSPSRSPSRSRSGSRSRSPRGNRARREA